MDTTSSSPRLPEQVGQAVTDLADVVASWLPLTDAGVPVEVPSGPTAGAVPGCLPPAQVLRAVCRRAGVLLEPGPPDGTAPVTAPGLAPAAPPVAGAVRVTVRDLLARGELSRFPTDRADQLDRLVAAALTDTVVGWRSHDVRSGDGTLLRTYAAGPPGAPAVLIASACGMPAVLAQPWMRHLSRSNRVVTWETRALFPPLDGGPSADARGYGVRDQVDDLLAVASAHGLHDVHVMGLCGGAVLAVEAAAADPQRVTSLSLWHGDFELGARAAKTDHQRNLKALLDMGGQTRADAAVINGALQATAMSVAVPDVAHVVMYPYLSTELFFRYCRLTGAIMGHDVGPALESVHQPVLVVTSEDDRTAHPAGSRWVADHLPAATWHVEPHGDHLSVFGAGAPLRHALAAFVASTAVSA